MFLSQMHCICHDVSSSYLMKAVYGNGINITHVLLCSVFSQVSNYKCCVLFVKQGIDVKSMGRIFIGLIKCGAWGCFDEFNRLEEAVLSAVSMQIQVIQDAIKQRSPSVELLGRKVSSLLMVGAQIFKTPTYEIMSIITVPQLYCLTCICAVKCFMRLCALSVNLWSAFCLLWCFISFFCRLMLIQILVSL